MSIRISAVAAASLLALAGSAFATTANGPSFASNAGVDFGNPPPASVIVANGGLEWIWAAPCSEGPGSCGAPTHHSGFRTPTLAEWATWADRATLVAAFTGKCGSPWMSGFHNHCDGSDLANGHIWGAAVNGICDPSYFNGCVAGTTESFLVRGVPEPQTYALMAAGLGLVGFMARRRRQA